MTNRILSIKKVYNIPFNLPEIEKWYSENTGDGFEIITEQHKYQLLIDNEQQCCEKFGLDTDDNFEDYIGANVLSIEKLVTDLSTPEDTEIGDVNKVLFLRIHTSSGEITFKVYNCHNGYYSHTVVYLVKDGETIITKDVEEL